MLSWIVQALSWGTHKTTEAKKKKKKKNWKREIGLKTLSGKPPVFQASRDELRSLWNKGKNKLEKFRKCFWNQTFQTWQSLLFACEWQTANSNITISSSQRIYHECKHKITANSKVVRIAINWNACIHSFYLRSSSLACNVSSFVKSSWEDDFNLSIKQSEDI